jgi:LPXTG-motif cell wall-anchored protein
MQGIFATRPLSAQEQADLLAFFAQVDQSPLPAAGQTATYTFLAIGGAGLVVLLLVLLFYWPRQRLNMNQLIRRLQ